MRPPDKTATTAPRTLGVLICSYQRPGALETCLRALAAQLRRPDEVIAVIRETDAKTRDAIGTWAPNGAPNGASDGALDGLPLRVLTVSQPGKVHALNAGMDAATSDILTIADDDTVAPPDWTRRIFDHFAADPRLGGLGGRDRCHDGVAFDDARQPVVGRLAWFGRTIGNHHRGFGAARPVDFLKGANMSFRAEAFGALRFDTRLRGSGAQPHEDLGFSLAVRHAGWKLVYDPAVTLEHYPAAREEPRHYVAGKAALEDTAGYFNTSYNNVLALWDKLSPGRRACYMGWALLIGMRTRPGLLQALRMTPAWGLGAWQRFGISQRAHLAAYAFLLSPRRAPRPQGAAITPQGVSKGVPGVAPPSALPALGSVQPPPRP